MKCNECGAELLSSATECPNCGCPVSENNPEVSVTTEPPAGGENIKKKPIFKINIMAVIALILGVIIVGMGLNVKNMTTTMDTYSAKYYNADSARFGADFYTEIYGASDIIVDELNDINHGIASLSESLTIMVNVLYYPIGMGIVAIGLAVIAVACIHIKKETV